jgi:hypothetical protein
MKEKEFQKERRRKRKGEKGKKGKKEEIKERRGGGQASASEQSRSQ